MTEKRYFKREWEEEYYIFDSETISEKEFDEKVEYEDYQAFADSMMGDEVVDRLNQLERNNNKLITIIDYIAQHPNHYVFRSRDEFFIYLKNKQVID